MPLFSKKKSFLQLSEVPGNKTLISNKTLHGKYNAFPKVLRTENTAEHLEGKIWAFWYSGDSHIDNHNDGRIAGCFSITNGTTWSEPEIIYDDPSYDCRNIGVICAPNGDLILFFAKVDVSLMKKDKKNAWVDFGFIKSLDHGQNWSPYVSLKGLLGEPNLGIKNGNGYGDPVIIDGAIYILNYGHTIAGREETHLTFLCKSSDNGDSWQILNVLRDQTGISSSEADFWYTEPLLFGFSRTQNAGPRYLYYFDSKNKGNSWDSFQKTNIQGDCPEIMRLSDGRYLIAIRAYQNSSTFLGYFTLPADFINISDKTALITNIDLKCLDRTSYRQRNGDSSYPSIIQIQGQQILVIYYDIGAGGVFAKICKEADIL